MERSISEMRKNGTTCLTFMSGLAAALIRGPPSFNYRGASSGYATEAFQREEGYLPGSSCTRPRYQAVSLPGPFADERSGIRPAQDCGADGCHKKRGSQHQPGNESSNFVEG